MIQSCSRGLSNHCMSLSRYVGSTVSFHGWQAVLVLIALILPATSTAQYFGRNKIQYDDFDFTVYRSKHFDVHYYPAEEQAARDMALMAERWNDRYEHIFEHSLDPQQPVILYSSHADFQQTNVISGLIGQGTGGVTEGLLNRVVMPLSGVYAEDNHVLGHELVHAFQYRAIKEGRRGLGSTNKVPLWFIEGMAEYLSLGRRYPLTDMWLRDAVAHGDIPSFDDMSSDPKYFPYRWGHAFWIFIAERYDDATVGYLFHNVLSAGWNDAFVSTLGVEPDSLSAIWRDHIETTYHQQITGLTSPRETGTRLSQGESDMNLSPAISPDGQFLAILSQRGLFTIDLYLLDAKTGEEIRTLASASANAHFDALRFIDASGGWSPDNRQLALAVFEDGDNGIALLNVADGTITQKIELPQVESISHVAWSPNGQRLAISGSHGGQSDLYVYSLDSGDLEQLTDDRYAELQPAWSPDGTSIAFATDRGPDTDFQSLRFGPMRLAVMDVAARAIQLIDIFENAKHINPQFEPGGGSLVFVADPDGISNIYRYELAENRVTQITDVVTGISGLSSLSPCLSVAPAGGSMAFTVFDSSGYRLHTLSPGAAGESAPIATQDIDFRQRPGGTGESEVDAYLSRAKSASSYDDSLGKTDYDASLKLYQAGVTSVGVAADRFGTSVGGGSSLLFTDLLGNHLLGVTAQINGGLKDFGGQVFYMNRKNRLNWGGVLGHVPYQSIAARNYIDTVSVNGQPAEVLGQELLRRRVFSQRASLVTEYPLTRNTRLEFGAGFNRLSYDYEIERAVLVGGRWQEISSQEVDAPSALNLGQASTAYVGDYSYLGFTSPIAGHRYRFEAEPTFGSLNFVTILADYRQYYHLNPFTLALRGLHYGRYLDDSENERLTPIFLGQQTLVRGYSSGSFTLEDCDGGANGECPEFDRLVGSRIGVLNAELRFPLFGTSEYGALNFSYLPTELLVFADAGVAWTESESPKLRFDTNTHDRVPVVSAGVGARVNILGYIVAQVYWARPFHRSENNSQWGFLIAPGW